jgi:hypothetical protein
MASFASAGAVLEGAALFYVWGGAGGMRIEGE